MARNRQCYSISMAFRPYPHTSKTGYMFILDRRTGQSLYPYKEVPVPTTPGISTSVADPTRILD